MGLRTTRGLREAKGVVGERKKRNGCPRETKGMLCAYNFLKSQMGKERFPFFFFFLHIKGIRKVSLYYLMY